MASTYEVSFAVKSAKARTYPFGFVLINHLIVLFIYPINPQRYRDEWPHLGERTGKNRCPLYNRKLDYSQTFFTRRRNTTELFIDTAP